MILQENNHGTMVKSKTERNGDLMKNKQSAKRIAMTIMYSSWLLCMTGCNAVTSEQSKVTENTELQYNEKENVIASESMETSVTLEETTESTVPTTQPTTTVHIAYETEPDDKKCGDDIEWDYYEDHSQLNVYGKGAMYDYDNSDLNYLKSGPAPWMPQYISERSSSYEIKEIGVGRGITEISGFGGCGVNVVDLPGTLQKINAKAFSIVCRCIRLRSHPLLLK